MAELLYVPVSELGRLRSLDTTPERRASAFAAACRINALYMIARAGSGHIGTSFSSIDLVSWLFLEEMRLPTEGGATRDLYFSSKGHDAPALYAVLAGLGLLDFALIHGLRRLGGLPGHPDVATPFVEANTGSLGMGISKAKGMALANRLLGTPSRVYVMTGDGELQEGQIWESLPSAAALGLGEICVDRRPQQDPVGHLGRRRERFGRPRREVRRLRLARGAGGRARLRRGGRGVPSAAARSPTDQRCSSPTPSRARACRSWSRRAWTPRIACTGSTAERRAPRCTPRPSRS